MLTVVCILHQIYIIGDALACERCGLVVDQVIVNPDINNIGEGIMMLFASYFVLNPDKENKRNKNKGKHKTVNPKVFTLINALKGFSEPMGLIRCFWYTLYRKL